MRRIGTIFLLLVTCSTGIGAQVNSHSPQATVAPTDARYVIVQSEIAARWTFRLDRWTGHVAELVTTKSGDFTWQQMDVQGLAEAVAPLTPHFLIFTSGIAARFTFLLDTRSGASWVLVSTKAQNPDGTETQVDLWQPVVE